MSEKRRDTKGRVLRMGERQRSDGMYEFRYSDIFGKKHSVYSWKLVETDKIPSGKRCKESLREMERRIQHDIDDGLDVNSAHGQTLNQCFDAMLNLKYEIKESTKCLYKMSYDRYIRNSLGEQIVTDIKYSDIKRHYINLLKAHGLSPSTVNRIGILVQSTFKFAVKNNIIRSNPAEGILKELGCHKGWDGTKRKAMTIQEQSAFIDYCSTSATFCRWMPLFTFLLGTGCRIGEATGLRWEDCDFKNKQISINHTLIYGRTTDNPAYRFRLTTTKTKSGTRVIPMTKSVEEALHKERTRQNKQCAPTKEVDGYSDFVFTTKNGGCIAIAEINRTLQRIVHGYNSQELKAADREDREPLLLPPLSAHWFRHTFCTRLCENESNIKVIQTIMGHANITTTMDIYSEATKDAKAASLAALERNVRIS